MNKKEAERIDEQEYRLVEEYGLTHEEAESLRLISKTLHSWGERECNGDVERDEATGLCYAGRYDSMGNQCKGYRVPDRETGALKRAQAIMEKHEGLAFYHQTDPRGAALYIYRLGDLRPGQEIDCCYSTVGICVY